MSWQILQGDCIERMRQLEPESVDAIVTDPPYGLSSEPDAAEVLRHWLAGDDYEHTGGGFMGKSWDSFVPGPTVWKEAHRVLKPGGHLIAFFGTRTYDLGTLAVRLAGFEIRDQIAWMFGSGFSKSWNFKTMFRGDWCECANPLPYSHASDVDMPGLREGVSAPAEPRGEGEGADLFLPMQRRESGPGLEASCPQGQGGVVGRDGGGVSREDQGRRESLLAGRLIHRAGQGLSDGEDARASEGEGERLRAGTHSDRRGDAGPTAEAGRGSSPQEQGSGGQSTRESSSVRESQRALDDGALFGRGCCQGCGGLLTFYEGAGTGIKPAYEPIVVARKPLIGTVAQNVLEHGTGAINIDGCRVGVDGGTAKGSFPNRSSENVGKGRWPANVVLDPEAGAMLDEQTGESKSQVGHRDPNGSMGYHGGAGGTEFRLDGYSDTGGASRFFLSVTPDTLCALCSLPCVDSAGSNTPRSEVPLGTAAASVPAARPPRRGGSKQASGAPAKPAAKGSTTTRVTEPDDSVAPDAATTRAESIVHLARSAANLCEPCATATAQSVAQWLRGQTPDSRAGRVSTSEPNVQILSRSLALIAAGMESTGITPTTADLKASFGSACRVTENGTAATDTESSPSRFRYQSKTSSAERNAGLDGFDLKDGNKWASGGICAQRRADGQSMMQNAHPTVKPIALMRWLCRLITPPGGAILDPFNGSGSTGCAAVLEGFNYIGIDLEPEYIAIAEARIKWWEHHPEGVELADRLKEEKARTERESAGQISLLGEAA